jgi:hypothetical protein
MSVSIESKSKKKIIFNKKKIEKWSYWACSSREDIAKKELKRKVDSF